MTSAITTAGLLKSFGGKIVLDGIDLEVGAGTTLVHADGGEVRVAGRGVARPGGGTGHDRGHRGSAEISTGSGKV